MALNARKTTKKNKIIKSYHHANDLVYEKITIRTLKLETIGNRPSRVISKKDKVFSITGYKYILNSEKLNEVFGLGR